jgi:hypothetical protein
MSTIAEKLQIILNAKTAIKSAIEAKGVSDVGDKIEDYATKIGEISGSSSEYSDVDGMCYAYSTITEFPEGWKFTPRSTTHCANMFSTSKSLTKIPQLDTSKGTNFYAMFEDCSSLTTIPQLDTSKGTNFAQMFINCSSLITIPQLDTSKGTNFYAMFFECSSLTTLGGLVGLSKALSLSESTELTHDSLMNVINNLATVTSSTTLTLGSTNLAKLTDEEKKVATDKGWTLA